MSLEREEQPYYIFKICLLGQGAVGKTCIARRLCFDTFDANTRLTIGIDFYTYDLPILVDGNETFIRLSLWDFGGQEQFKQMFSYYIHGANGIFMVFSLFNLNNTLLGLDWWYEHLFKQKQFKTPKLLIGCKSDLVKNLEKVDELVIESFRKKHDKVKFFKSSAKENYNVREIFVEMTKNILDTHSFKYDKFL
ncbi:MAG: GTP-binding protein [Candidatus Lokiarchaeota archaeon]|jgi:small GTP-binding protein|nr:GTP-binding protein [Candidatus Lokiarchaeota archaeon]